MTTTTAPKYMAVQAAAFLVGAVFVVVGILGFIPGVTTHFDLAQWAGHHSGAKLFGVFAVSVLHNLVHLAFGVAGVLLARTYVSSRYYLLYGGLIYLALWAHGETVDHTSRANFMPVNDADNWLHFGLGVVMVLLGLTLAARHDPTKARSRRRA